MTSSYCILEVNVGKIFNIYQSVTYPLLSSFTSCYKITQGLFVWCDLCGGMFCQAYTGPGFYSFLQWESVGDRQQERANDGSWIM